MATTVNAILNLTNTAIGDASTDRVTAAERLQSVNEAVIWLQEELQNDLQNVTYALDYFDTIHYYKVTTALADLLDGADLRRKEADQDLTFTHKSARELSEEIGQNFGESSWAIERRDANAYLVVNHDSKYGALVISGFDSTTDGGGTWALDTTNGDGTNLTVDTNEFVQGSGCLNFDIDVSQTANNKVVLTNSTLTAIDLSDYEDISSFLFDVYIPSATYTSSFTLYWGSDSSNYWSATVTTDINGSAWATGWNTVKINWADATKTLSPDVAALDYIQLDLNYTASQADDTDYRIDHLRVVRPEKLTFHYLSWYVGTNSGGTDLVAFTATSDIPYFSGQYDQYIYPVSHKAASILFRGLRLKGESDSEVQEAQKALKRLLKIHPQAKTPEVKSFKVRGVNFRSRGRNRNFRV